MPARQYGSHMFAIEPVRAGTGTSDVSNPFAVVAELYILLELFAPAAQTMALDTQLARRIADALDMSTTLTRQGVTTLHQERLKMLIEAQLQASDIVRHLVCPRLPTKPPRLPDSTARRPVPRHALPNNWHPGGRLQIASYHFRTTTLPME